MIVTAKGDGGTAKLLILTVLSMLLLAKLYILELAALIPTIALVSLDTVLLELVVYIFPKASIIIPDELCPVLPKADDIPSGVILITVPYNLSAA